MSIVSSKIDKLFTVKLEQTIGHTNDPIKYNNFKSGGSEQIADLCIGYIVSSVV
jgi:hypothetical protein